MWKRLADGKVLTFHLAGINNQNFIMRDEETGTFWQQISGKAISGPLAGKQLELVHSDELTASLWKSEVSNGTVLRPVEEYKSSYAKKDWDVRMKKVPTVLDFPATKIASRELMAGVEWNGQAKAFPVESVLSEKVIQDRVGGAPVMLVAGPDNKSIRGLHRTLPGKAGEVEFYRTQGKEFALMDSATGSTWDFRGCATSGPAKGTCLEPITVTKDYWFDWRNYHGNTSVYKK